MRMLVRNKQKMFYSQKGDKVPIYEKDDAGNIIYTEEDGELVPVETGDYEIRYTEPVEFYGNISLSSGGDALTVEYGIDVSNYDAILVMRKGDIELSETSLIWYESEPSYKDGFVDPKSADYNVLAVKPTLNEIKYILGHVTK